MVLRRAVRLPVALLPVVQRWAVAPAVVPVARVAVAVDAEVVREVRQVQVRALVRPTRVQRVPEVRKARAVAVAVADGAAVADAAPDR